MPHLTERRKATQRDALEKQRRRLKRKNNIQRTLSRLNHDIRAAARTIARRKKLIEKAEKPEIHLAGSHTSGCDKVTGGTAQQRLVEAGMEAVHRSANGSRGSFYSQTGGWDLCHGITGESSDKRSDCSQFVTALYHACGLPDPNGQGYAGGFTGTLGTHGRAVSSKALQPGDLGLYGSSYPYHHVEMYVGNGKWVGHGSPPVDQITPGYPSVFRRYI